MKTLFCILYLAVGFVPYFGTIDKIGSQWFYLTIINSIFLFISLSDRRYLSFLLECLKINYIRFYIIFVSFALLSLFYSNNFTVSIVDISRIITTFIVFINFSYLFFNSNLNLLKLSVIISFILLFEITYAYFPLYEFLKHNSFLEIDFNTLPNALRGVTGNKNVFAADIVFKLPFVFFLINHNKKSLIFFSLALSFISFFTLFLLSARASLISLIIIFSLYIIYSFLNFSLKKISLSLLLSIFLAISVYLIESLPSNNLSLLSRANSISTNDDSTSYRIILWENAVDFISNNPIIGCGIGNWKIESLPYWKDRLTGYTIPYHAHNDFLEITTETGLFGGLSYLLIFITIFIICIRSIFKFKNYPSFMLLSILIVYFIDGSLNFPLERALSQVNFAVLLCLTLLIYKNEKV
jgi:O-antigen ligase